MAFNVSDFKQNFRGGARPTQFQVVITPPVGLLSGLQGNKLTFLCHATTAPPMIQDSIRVYYFGRPVKFAGDRDFPDWTVSIYNDEDFQARNVLEAWSNEINTLVSNRMDPAVWPDGYKTVATVLQYDRKGDIIKSYEMDGIFPVNVDAMALSWDAVNQVQTFDCTFAYDYWQPGADIPSNFTGILSSDGFGG